MDTCVAGWSSVNSCRAKGLNETSCALMPVFNDVDTVQYQCPFKNETQVRPPFQPPASFTIELSSSLATSPTLLRIRSSQKQSSLSTESKGIRTEYPSSHSCPAGAAACGQREFCACEPAVAAGQAGHARAADLQCGPRQVPGHLHRPGSCQPMWPRGQCLPAGVTYRATTSCSLAVKPAQVTMTSNSHGNM